MEFLLPELAFDTQIPCASGCHALESAKEVAQCMWIVINGSEKMEMVRHEDVVSDKPLLLCRDIAKRIRYDLREGRVRQNFASVASANCHQKYSRFYVDFIQSFQMSALRSLIVHVGSKRGFWGLL